MRDDFNGELPGIRATDEDRVGAGTAEQVATAEPPLVRALREPAPQRQRNGALWAVCVSLLIALVGLGYWSHQQQSRLQQQLVATQESFARISEDAAGQLQDISGKVLATESSLSEVEQARIRQINELQEKVAQLLVSLEAQEEGLQAQQQVLHASRQQLTELQQASAAQTERLAELAGLSDRVGSLVDQQQLQEQGISGLQHQVEQVEEGQAALRNELAQADTQLEQLAVLKQQLAEQDTELARQRGQLQALLEASSAPSVEPQRLEAVDDALRSVDSFRVQTNRTLSTLQTQIGNLQQQMNQR